MRQLKGKDFIEIMKGHESLPVLFYCQNSGEVYERPDVFELYSKGNIEIGKYVIFENEKYVKGYSVEYPYEIEELDEIDCILIFVSF